MTYKRKEIIGDATLYLGDCLEVMKGFSLCHVDGIVTDPPYFTPAIHYQSRIKYSKSWGDMSIIQSWWGMVTNEFTKITYPHSHVLVFCNGSSYPAFYISMFPHFEKLKCLIWDKKNVGLGRLWRNQHELIIAGRNAKHFLPTDGKLRADVFSFKATPSSDRDHPVEKPTNMIRFLIESISKNRMTIFDPFMGSGSTGIASVSNDRKFIGIEIDEKYFDIACKRIEQAQRQVNLF